ncbi:MAG: hypothetical protein ACJ716_14055 [Marmoricola sp.]
MAENDDPTTGPEDQVPAPAETTPVPVAEQTVVTTQAAPAEPRTRFTDRVWNFRAMVAVALAALLLGGGIGAAISAVSHDDGHDRRPGFARFEDGPPGYPGGPGLGPQQRQQFRKDFKEFRQRMKQHLDQEAPPPAPPTPTPTKSS